MTISFLDLSSSPKINDNDWVHDCFMLSSKQIPAAAYKMMMRSSADHKVSDTRPGGNLAINMPPAYTRFADPRSSGLPINGPYGVRPVGLGMYWSDQIDENAQIIHMQFGVSTFRGMLSFFTSVSNIEAGILARTGRVSVSFFIGKAVGFVVGLRLLPFMLVGKAIKFLMNRTGSKYYNFKPAMHPYWSRVNFIANSIAVAEGLVDRTFGSAKDGAGAVNYNNPNDMTAERSAAANNTAQEPADAAADMGLVRLAHAACPELFIETGGVDVYRIASRYQELANARQEFLKKLVEQETVENLIQRLIEYQYSSGVTVNKAKSIKDLAEIHRDDNEFGGPGFHDGDQKKDNFATAAEAQASSLKTALSGGNTTTADVNNGTGVATPTDTSTTTTPSTVTEASGDRSYVTYDATWINDEAGNPKRQDGWFRNWWNKLSATSKSGFDGGFSWVAFKVNSTGPVSASFSNSTTTPEIKSTINNFSSNAAKMRFNFSQGATGVPGIDAVVSGIKNAALGFASGIELMGLVSLAGTSFIDIPDTWEDSSAQLPQESYSIHLRSPYGNVLSRYINIHIPYSMLLAGALPISTGRQSYASPFICQLISVGRSATRLGMIDNLQATHGVGNLGFTRDGKPLGMDISLSVKDLNRNVHAPIDTGGAILNPLNALSIFDDDNAFNEYLNVLSAMSVADQTLATRRLQRNMRLKMMQYDSFFSAGHFSLAMTESAPGRALRSAASAVGMVWPSVAPGLDKIG